MRKVEVTSYNKDWPFLYEEEANRLRRIFGSEIIEMDHIGSTSVEGLIAKPVIDIMPVVKDIERIDDFNTAMIDIGYEPKGENGLPGRRYFQKGGDQRTHHIHFYKMGDSEVERHLAFRNYLRSHPEAVKEYGDLKKELAQNFPYDIEAYINGKEQLVSKIDKKAIAWHQGSSEH
ncbi:MULTISPECIES: GrpB family protein [Salimicrobium]|uniref:GrpB family protein n=1 Tax=Salimicrobium humidisoli TaxID=2029857 RepID=A0ABX4HNA7_9BACI|nr:MULTISPECIES: GrpB family protein [Salimicrobium]PBB04664.1 hypothetical protein CKW00_12890 [Salimicrobium humidisoli]